MSNEERSEIVEFLQKRAAFHMERAKMMHDNRKTNPHWHHDKPESRLAITAELMGLARQIARGDHLWKDVENGVSV